MCRAAADGTTQEAGPRVLARQQGRRPERHGSSMGGGGAHQHVAGVAVSQREAGVGNQVREAVGAAQQALLGVVVKAALGLGDGGLEGQRGGGALLVLQQQEARRAGRAG